MINVIWLCVGLALLIFGGDILVRGAVSLANKLHVPPLLVGLTIVAFGTSTPELMVNLIASYEGANEIGFGNVIGSNIGNIGLLLGLTALYRPLSVHQAIVIREIPMMLLMCAGAMVMVADIYLTEQSAAVISRDDGLILLLFFIIFLYYLLGDVLSSRDAAGASERPSKSWRLTIVFILGGLLALLAGGRATVTGAVGIAELMGMPQVVIGLTIVAVGTSLPELATSILAARQGQTDIAIGNIVGSNIFNLAFIMGLSSTILPVPVPSGGMIDILFMFAFAVVLLPLAWTQHTISRKEGALLLVGYGIYLFQLLSR